MEKVFSKFIKDNDLVKKWHTQNSELKFIDVNLQFAKQRLNWPLSSTVLEVLNPMGEETSSAALTL